MTDNPNRIPAARCPVCESWDVAVSRKSGDTFCKNPSCKQVTRKSDRGTSVSKRSVEFTPSEEDKRQIKSLAKLFGL